MSSHPHNEIRLFDHTLQHTLYRTKETLCRHCLLQPVYLTSLVPYDNATKEDATGKDGEESAVAGTAGEESGTPAAAAAAVPEEQEGGETRAPDRERSGKELFPPWKFQTYKEAASKYYLHLSDNNMVGGANTVETL